MARRLRRNLKVEGMETGALVENDGAKQYRLSVPPANITLDVKMITRHFPGADKVLSGLDLPSDEQS